MKRCECGSYAINIERLYGDNCDVCHYKNRAIKLESMLRFLVDNDSINDSSIEKEVEELLSTNKQLGG